MEDQREDLNYRSLKVEESKRVITKARNCKNTKDIYSSSPNFALIPRSLLRGALLDDSRKRRTVIAQYDSRMVDLGVMKAVGFPAAPVNAREEVKEVACYVTQKEGGRGTVREIAELILKTQGKWEGLIEKGYGKQTPEF